MSDFRFGIEHEVAFLDGAERFVDFASTPYSLLQAVIDELPLYPRDQEQLRIGDAGIRVKRWYLEALERLSPEGEWLTCLPKGIEIRTTIHPDIRGAVQELQESFALLCQVAARHGFTPVLTSYNPYQSCLFLDPPLNPYEWRLLDRSPEDRTALSTFLTYGPDLSLSCAAWSVEQLIDHGRKLTYYSPYIVPFSFSSPFYEGRLWEGLSVRTFLRTGQRPAALVFVAEEDQLIYSSPSLTKLARIPAEIGRLEFKACDSCADFSLYAALLALLKGLTLDVSLPGRATVPDATLHQRAALRGFDDEELFEGARQVLLAASRSLAADEDSQLLEPLFALLEKRQTPAHQMIAHYRRTGSLKEALRFPYLASQGWTCETTQGSSATS
ncbi:glutamate--cysteine ligase [Thermogemmatispora sp.]|uniref:glutamate--cysteine ligase n=1 Tax=Thermogemmatispora sp. TaxID=1968838 RepID=UPI0035E40005